MSHLTVAIAVARTLTAVLGGLTTCLAYVAYRRTGPANCGTSGATRWA